MNANPVSAKSTPLRATKTATVAAAEEGAALAAEVNIDEGPPEDCNRCGARKGDASWEDCGAWEPWVFHCDDLAYVRQQWLQEGVVPRANVRGFNKFLSLIHI